MNDNTSGVVTLLSIMSSLPEKSRSNIAFIFFDNEEKGLLGARFFKCKHKYFEKLMINFDCVSDGDHFLIVSSREAMKSPKYEFFEASFENNLPRDKQLEFTEKGKVSSNSDDKIFKQSIRVMALKTDSKNRLYLDRIHTKHDDQYKQENIDYLTSAICDFVDA
jgi:Zn-dependent M28 family amino/carboxypeptidase